MPRSSQYVSLLKKLIEASQLGNIEDFDRSIEEIRAQMAELDAEERFDLEMNIKTETKTFHEKLSE